MNKDVVKKKNQAVYTQRTLLVISSLMILAVGVWFLFGMAWGQIQKSFSIKVAIKAAETQKNVQIERLNKAKKIIKEFEGQKDIRERLSLSLPSSTKYYQVINEIANLSGLTSVKILSESFKEKALISKSLIKKTHQINYVSAGSKIIKPYTIINLMVSGEGTYSRLKTFLNLLEKDIRLMDIKEFSFKRVKSIQNQEDLADPELRFNLKVSFYRQEQ